MGRTLNSYYRAPEALLNSVTSSLPSGSPEFFRFEQDLICFAKSGRDSHANNDHNSLSEMKSEWVDDLHVRLPFDFDEAVENLRGERYVSSDEGAAKRLQKHLLHKAYYAVRPVLPLSVRKHMQKVHLRGWKDIAFPQWPVDVTVDRLMARALQLSVSVAKDQLVPFIWFWPDGADGCSIMTHDVEAEEGRDFCSRLMDINDSYSIPASFQIVPEKRYEVTASFLDGIRNRGFEVNVQDLDHDGRLFRDRAEFLRRVKKINTYRREYGAAGFRSAILYRNQDWFGELDFEYDMSVPNVAHLDPQRGGCCTVMPFFIGDMLELPVTTTQDHSLFNILNDYSMTLWQQQADIILQHHGLVSFIVHPDYIVGKKAQDAYKSLLAFISRLRDERNVWLAKPVEVNRWWRLRNKMSLEWRNGRWNIEGEGKERARIAYASVEGAELKYCRAELSGALR